MQQRLLGRVCREKIDRNGAVMAEREADLAIMVVASRQDRGRRHGLAGGSRTGISMEGGAWWCHANKKACSRIARMPTRAAALRCQPIRTTAERPTPISILFANPVIRTGTTEDTL